MLKLLTAVLRRKPRSAEEPIEERQARALDAAMTDLAHAITNDHGEDWDTSTHAAVATAARAVIERVGMASVAQGRAIEEHASIIGQMCEAAGVEHYTQAVSSISVARQQADLLQDVRDVLSGDVPIDEVYLRRLAAALGLSTWDRDAILRACSEVTVTRQKLGQVRTSADIVSAELAKGAGECDPAVVVRGIEAILELTR